MSASDDREAPQAGLKAWRQRQGWSQRQAAEQLGTGLKTYQQWERGVSWVTGQPIEPPRIALLAAAALENEIEPIPLSSA